MKFGVSQIFHPTPATAKAIFKTVFITTTIIGMILNFFPQIPKAISDPINVYIVEINGFVFALTRMFGIQVDPPESK